MQIKAIAKVAALVLAMSHFTTVTTPTRSLAEIKENAVEMQVAMQRHIERNSVNGALLKMDPKTAELIEVFPINAHPMILKGPGHFVLCSNLQDKNGNKFNVDFYMVNSQRGWRVFKTAINDRGKLRAMHKAGIYARY